MKKTERKAYGHGLVVVWMLGIGILSGAGSGLGRSNSSRGAEPPLRIIVRLREYKGVPHHVLEDAEREATWIFRQVGIEAAWAECSPHLPLRSPACFEAGGVPVIDLNIAPHAMAMRLSPHENALGFTPFTDEGGRASLAFVFYDRVNEEAEHRVASLSQILAYAMAHELGHLLLRTSGHSSAGIMRASWTAGDLRLAAERQLRFTPQQAELMRGEVMARTEQQAAAERAAAPGSH